MKKILHSYLFAALELISVKRPHLLLANDDPNFLILLGDSLAQEGFDVETAASIEQAESALTSGRVAALLVDLKVGKSNGLDLVRRLRLAEATSGLPIVVVSARVSSEARSVALASGADAFVGKPLEVAELADIVRKLLESSG